MGQGTTWNAMRGYWETDFDTDKDGRIVQTFRIPLIPTAQGRPRAFSRGRHAAVYKDARSRRYEENLAAAIMGQLPVMAPKGESVKVELLFELPRPKSHYNAGGGVKQRYIRLYHVCRPDLDNLVKAAKDACKGVLWHDDSQICFLQASKVYSTAPSVEITVWW